MPVPPTHGKALSSSSVLTETCAILEEWTRKGLVKRVWSNGDFPDIADGIDRRINTFRDTFSVSGVFDVRF